MSLCEFWKKVEIRNYTETVREREREMGEKEGGGEKERDEIFIVIKVAYCL